MNMFLIFSHKLTLEQRENAKALGVDRFVEMPDELKMLWSNIPPALPYLFDYLEPFRLWLQNNGNRGDYALIQGDSGAVFLMVNYAFSLGIIPVYATAKRVLVEEIEGDNVVKTSRIFRHVMFRLYEKK